MSRSKATTPFSTSHLATRRPLLRGLVGLVLVAAVDHAPVVLADDLTGAELAWKYHCMTCHGEKGAASSDSYPNIAGQNQEYLAIRLRYFRSKAEPGNKMNAQAAPLSDAEIETLARYFANGESS